jgi:hypothetical protein
MSNRRISVVPDGECSALFRDATISVVQVGPNHIPDYEPVLLDRALVRIQTAMLGKRRRDLDDVRTWLDWPPSRSRRELGVRHLNGEPSDVSLAAALLWPDGPFGIQYHWAPGVVPAWPDGLCLVLWRGRLYERTGDVLQRWHEPGASS